MRICDVNPVTRAVPAIKDSDILRTSTFEGSARRHFRAGHGTWLSGEPHREDYTTCAYSILANKQVLLSQPNHRRVA